MKCPRCQHDHKRKEGMVCNGCGNCFVFDPKEGYRFTDGWFAGVLRRGGAGGTRSFTKGQLMAVFLLCRHKRSGFSWFLFVFVTVWSAGFFGGFGSVLFDTSAFFFIAPALAMVLILRGERASRAKRPSNDELDRWLARWTEVYGPIEGLVTTPSLAEPPPSEARDLYDYGVEHLLVVDDELLVDVLVKNNWAQEQRCLVVCESGYPMHIHTLALRFLEEQAELPVWLYHAASRATMEADLRAKGWPLAGHPVRDLGLSPGVARHGYFAKRHLPGIEPRELRGDMLPPALLTGALTAMLLAGNDYLPLLQPPMWGESGIDIDFESDFG